MQQTTDAIKTQVRTGRGTSASNRLRRDGFTPVIIYGHGKATQSMAVSSEELKRAFRGGHHVLTLDIDGSPQKTLVKDVQYDALGDYVLHVDFVRISEHERVEVTVTIQLVGQAPGAASGGIMDQSIHEARISCPADQIPESLKLVIGELEIEQSLHVSDLELPAGVEILHAPEETVVAIHKPGVAEEVAEEGAEEEGEGAPSQPEVIGQKAEEEEGGEK